MKLNAMQNMILWLLKNANMSIKKHPASESNWISDKDKDHNVYIDINKLKFTEDKMLTL